jgi:hypothetical protein
MDKIQNKEISNTIQSPKLFREELARLYLDVLGLTRFKNSHEMSETSCKQVWKVVGLQQFGIGLRTGLFSKFVLFDVAYSLRIALRLFQTQIGLHHAAYGAVYLHFTNHQLTLWY